MKLSIIMPVYNVESYIDRAIESILRQTYTDYELLIVNDGSTDGTLKRCENWSSIDKRIKIITQENKGLSGARNTGLRNAKGEYVGFVDGDDFIDCNMYEILVNNAEKYECDISEAVKYTLSSKGEYSRKENDQNVKIFEHNDAMRDFLTSKNLNGSMNFKITRREIMSGLKFNEQMLNYEDVFFTYQCLKKCRKVCHQKISLYCVYERENSITRGGFKERDLNCIKYAEMILEDVKKSNLTNEDFAKMFVINTNIVVARKIFKSNYILENSVLELIKNNIIQNRTVIYKLPSKKRMVEALLLCYFLPLYRMIQKIWRHSI